MTLAGAAQPLRLLVVEPAAFAPFERHTLHRFADRVAAQRAQLVVALLGDEAVPELPDPDYLVAADRAVVVRLATGKPVAGWPRRSEADGGAADPAGAIAWLAHALMIPPIAVTVVTTPPADPGGVPPAWSVVSVGDTAPPPGWVGVEPGDGPRLMEAVDSALGGAPSPEAGDLADEAFGQAVASLRRNVTPIGFSAASLADNVLMDHDANYASVWARDGIISGLWSLAVGDPAFDATFRSTLELLAAHQTPAGQIPAYVRIAGEVPDYSGIGGIASIDSVLWYVIGVSRYAFLRRDRAFAAAMHPSAERAMLWLAAHDSNNDSLLEIPESSDWMDLFPRSYNVLYDEVLWYRACLDFAALTEAVTGDPGPWRQLAGSVQRRIVSVFWPTGGQLMELAGSTSGRFSTGEARYLLAQVTPFGYSWRCDVLANLLAALSGLIDDGKRQRVFQFLWGVGINQPSPVACLYPPIHSGADDWKDYFIVNFLNLPEHYHNGGAWPFIGSLWVRFLHTIGREELAHRELLALAEACRRGIGGDWEFNEWMHGRTGLPMGKAHQAWSAAGYLHTYLMLRRGVAPADFGPLDAAVL